MMVASGHGLSRISINGTVILERSTTGYNDGETKSDYTFIWSNWGSNNATLTLYVEGGGARTSSGSGSVNISKIVDQETGLEYRLK